MEILLLRCSVVVNLKYDNLTSSFGRLRQQFVPKSVLHDYFSSFNQSNHCFVALSLSLTFLKLPIISLIYLASPGFLAGMRQQRKPITAVP